MKRFLQNSTINIFAKIIITALFCLMLYRQVFQKEQLQAFFEITKKQLLGGGIYWLLLTIALVPINWAFETLKWQSLMREVEILSFKNAYKAILTGTTFSIFTPNRIGEYGGRILYAKPENQWKVVVATLVGSFSQQVVLIGVGAVGMLFFLYKFTEVDWLYLQGIALLSSMLLGIMLVCYFNVRIFILVFWKIKFLRKIMRQIIILRHFSQKELRFALLYAFIRYVIYSVQYFCLLIFFGIEADIPTMFAAIATVFILQTSIPLPPLFGLFVRGEVALTILGYISNNEIGILACTFGLWLLNLIFPALLGFVLLMRMNLMKSLGYKNP